MNSIEGGAAPLRDITATLVRRKWQVSITFLTIVAGVSIGTFLLPKQYETRMKILVKNERADMVVSAATSSGSGYRGEVSEAQINTEIELLNSNNLLQQVVAQCGLEKLERSGGSVARERLPVAIERAVLRLQRNLKISPVRKANIIEVKYAARNPQLAAAVLRHLAELYLEAHLRVHATPGTYEFFTKQAARYQSELKNAEAKLAEFRQKANVVMLAQQKDTMLQKASDSESALLQAEAAISEYREKIADTRKQLDAAAARVVTQSRTLSNQYSVERLGTMLAELQNKRTQLLAKFRSDDRSVQETSREIIDTQAALEKATKLTGLEQATDVNPVRQTLEIEMAKEQAELAGIDARRQMLARQAQSYRRQLMRLGDFTTEYEDLTRNQKEAEDNYLLYAKKTEESRIAESLDQQKIANVAVAETPAELHLPSKPNVPLNLALGVLMAGFLSLSLAFGLEYLSQAGPEMEVGWQIGPGAAVRAPRIAGSIEKPSDLEALTGLAVLATPYRP
ncbi:MAG: lipopolysaccharide biosynthesis protein [Bryobacterales bacterium]|nr:lipopolysaccharide biosynthesis protein [Bryobacterales bacterium]